MTQLSRLLLCLALPLAACGTPSEAAPAPARRNAGVQACVDVFARARSCTPQYVPALVDARARLDRPAGIAARVKADRTAVIAEATSEWQADSTDAAIAASCEKLAGAGAAGIDEGRRCLVQKDCAGFVACLTPVVENQLRQSGT
jgi:hypothetical protein